MTIYFYVEREKPYGCFSNFSAHGFMLDEWDTGKDCEFSTRCKGLSCGTAG